jgi:hypothetical protein
MGLPDSIRQSLPLVLQTRLDTALLFSPVFGSFDPLPSVAFLTSTLLEGIIAAGSGNLCQNVSLFSKKIQTVSAFKMGFFAVSGGSSVLSTP